MPIIASAKKKLRQDGVRTQRNKLVLRDLKAAVKKARTSPTAKTLQTASSALDTAAKKLVIHKNKAARLKSALAKLMTGSKTTKAAT